MWSWDGIGPFRVYVVFAMSVLNGCFDGVTQKNRPTERPLTIPRWPWACMHSRDREVGPIIIIIKLKLHHRIFDLILIVRIGRLIQHCVCSLWYILVWDSGGEGQQVDRTECVIPKLYRFTFSEYITKETTTTTTMTTTTITN